MTQSDNLWEQLLQYGQGEFYPYHMPGHKGRALGTIPQILLEPDITEIDGFDNLHQPEGILLALEKKANMLYGADETFFLVNGSTGGILAAISAVLPEGGHILMARGSHRCAYHAAYLRNLQTSYIYSEMLPGMSVEEAITPAQVEQALACHPDVQAVFIVSPTYEGRIADVAGIARVVHKRGIPLIVDEAHGAHLGFAEDFAAGSCSMGADIVIHSVHKTLPAMTQTALLHVNGELVDRERLRRFLKIYQSSSPSYILMSSIADALNIVECQGKELFANFYKQYSEMIGRLQSCKNLRVLPWEDYLAKKQDIGKLVIMAPKGKASGKWLYDVLREEFHLQCEMCAGEYCLAMFTLADGEDAYRRMLEACLEVDKRLDQDTNRAGMAREEGSQGESPSEREHAAFPFHTIPSQKVYSIRDAWDRAYRVIPLTEATGQVAADFVNLYPPGIPLLVPGERISIDHIQLLAEYVNRRMNVQGLEKREETLSIRVLE